MDDATAIAQREDEAPEVRFLPRWGFVLGPRDSLLVLKALGGRLESSDDIDAARALCDRLTVLRERQARGSYFALDRAAQAVEAKVGTT